MMFNLRTYIAAALLGLVAGLLAFISRHPYIQTYSGAQLRSALLGLAATLALGVLACCAIVLVRDLRFRRASERHERTRAISISGNRTGAERSAPRLMDEARDDVAV